MAVISPYKKSLRLFINISFILLLSFFIIFFIKTQPSPTHPSLKTLRRHQNCKSIDGLEGHQAKCLYLETHDPCPPNGYINYLYIFYCACGDHPSIGFTILALWLLVLFYLSASTASQYFCHSLEGLSNILKLPPSVAGATLLALGNGAPDVFSTVVSFAGSGGVSDVGLSSVLGGGLFVSTAVAGVIAVLVSPRSVQLDRSGFFRDACFLLAVLASLLAVLLFEKITLMASVCLTSLYVVYVLLVSVGNCRIRKAEELPAPLSAPLLDHVVVEEPKYEIPVIDNSPVSNGFGWLIYLLEMPLYLPRRLTIPDVRENRWSKPFAAASVALSPILLATLWNSGEMGSGRAMIVFMFAGLAGVVLGITALETTESSHPPKKFLLPWLAGGFLMSIVWSYITARELVALLVSIGHILSISPAILGVTVLAWGNSIGDLIANVAMTVSGGENGAQIAVSGCYAGPIFNTLVGLGLSLVFAAWGAWPSPLAIPRDPAVLETLGFLAAGVLWALVVLPSRGMRLDRVLGVGLLGIYLCFLWLGLSESIGLVELWGGS